MTNPPRLNGAGTTDPRTRGPTDPSVTIPASVF